MDVLISPGTTATTSSDFDVTTDPVTVMMYTDSGVSLSGASKTVTIELKAPNGQYHAVGQMIGGATAVVISGPGTYRVSRQASAEAFGVASS
jgi:hypothetical protein